jgi:hypothetical protein
MNKRISSVYCTWGLHDELGDQVELTEDLARKALQDLIRLRDLGLSFDYFVLDCFWYEPTEPLNAFRRKSWPGGGPNFLEEVRKAGFIPGLWFPVSGRDMTVPGWKSSLSADHRHYSLVDGAFHQDFEKALLHAAAEWGVRFFKLDFAAFGLPAEGVERDRYSNTIASTDRLRSILARVRSKFPDVHIMGHCGFWPNWEAQLLGNQEPFGADPSWLGSLDRLFSGDPQILGQPASDIVRSLDLFQDRQVWKLHQEGFPLARIDDHGVIIGNTNTCMYRGRRGFRRSWLASLARGGQRDILYGDIGLLTSEDITFAIAARSIYHDAFSKGLETRFLGPGEPGLAPWHGFLTGGGSEGLLYLSNSSWKGAVVQIKLPNLHSARTLYCDGKAPQLLIQDDMLSLELTPESSALIGLGKCAEVDPLPNVPEGQWFARIEHVSSWDVQDGEQEFEPGSWLICVRAWVRDSSYENNKKPYHFASQNTSIQNDMIPLSHEQVVIQASIPPEWSVPDVPVWSGTPWIVQKFHASERWKVKVISRLPGEISLEVHAWRIYA